MANENQLINVSAAKGYVETFLADPILKMAAYAVLNNAPRVDAVEVIRCENCRFSKFFPESGTRKCRAQNGLHRTVEDGDFYSYGERSEMV